MMKVRLSKMKWLACGWLHWDMKLCLPCGQDCISPHSYVEDVTPNVYLEMGPIRE